MNFRILFSLLLSSLVTLVYSQNMLTKNAVWTYNYQGPFEYHLPNHGYTQYSVDKDTVIYSKTVQKIVPKTTDSQGNEFSSSPLYFYENESKIYNWENNRFKLMYDFSLNEGDTLKIEKPEYCDSISPIIIDSVSTIAVEVGQALKVQHISYTSYWQGMKELVVQDIVENIGDQRWFVYTPTCGMFDNFSYIDLRCYQDDNVLFKNKIWKYRYPGVDCDEIITGFDKKISEQWQVYVNTSGDIVIDPNGSDQFSFELYTTSGKKLINGFGSNTTTVSTNSQSAGIYFLKVFSNESAIATYRVLK